MALVSTHAIVLSAASVQRNFEDRAPGNPGVSGCRVRLPRARCARAADSARRCSLLSEGTGAVSDQGASRAPYAHRVRPHSPARRPRRRPIDRYAAPPRLAEVMLRFAPADPHPESFDMLRDPSARSSLRRHRSRLKHLGSASSGVGRAFSASRHRSRPASSMGSLPARTAPCQFSASEGGALCSTCATLHGATQLPEDARVDLQSLLDPGRRLALAGCPTCGGSPATARAVYPISPRGRSKAPGPRLLDALPVGGRLIVGMAGHIDHGKSALVTALTGKAMDRLDEERRRGITIDLNFAPLTFGSVKPEWWTCPVMRTSSGRWSPGRPE